MKSDLDFWGFGSPRQVIGSLVTIVVGLSLIDFISTKAKEIF